MDKSKHSRLKDERSISRRSKEKKRQVEEEEPQEDIISEEIGVHQDFGFLINAPISEDDHFVFKSEKTWTVDTSKYSEFFTLDLKQLSAALESIPFLENVSIDQKYFTKDQLTGMHNKAEKAKQSFKKMLEALDNEQEAVQDEKKEESTDGTTDDNLDFLLKLSQPVTSAPVMYKTATTYGEKAESVSKKTIDLEKWLDSVLDD